MNSQIQQISRRMKELREILEMDIDVLCKQIGVDSDLYRKYEDGTCDIPIGILYAVANAMDVDPTVLLTGDSPKMSGFTIVRAGQGMSVERYPGYSFSSLAFNFNNRDMEPMLVNLEPTEEPEFVSHAGQEFNYVLRGKIKLIIGTNEFILTEGDSAYFAAVTPHGQRAVDMPACFLTVINE